jgi:hypothetical protein
MYAGNFINNFLEFYQTKVRTNIYKNKIYGGTGAIQIVASRRIGVACE